MSKLSATGVLFMLLAAGCATPSPEIRAVVPFHEQEEGHCGEAALAMLLEYSGKPADLVRLRQRLHLPALGGTVTDLMLMEARHQGVDARRISSADICTAGRSVTAPMAALLGPFDNGSVGHYVVLTGFRFGRWVEVHSGRTRNLRMDWSKFMDRWAYSEYEGIITTP